MSCTRLKIGVASEYVSAKHASCPGQPPHVLPGRAQECRAGRPIVPAHLCAHALRPYPCFAREALHPVCAFFPLGINRDSTDLNRARVYHQYLEPILARDKGIAMRSRKHPVPSIPVQGTHKTVQAQTLHLLFDATAHLFKAVCGMAIRPGVSGA